MLGYLYNRASYFPDWSSLKYTALTTYPGMTSILVLNAIIYTFGMVPVPSVNDFIFVIPHVFYTSVIASFIGILFWNTGNKILTPVNGILFMDIVPITAFSVSALSGVAPGAPEITRACITGAALIFNNLYLRYRNKGKTLHDTSPCDR